MNLVGVFLKGFAMGTANVIPGVSGGTIAFITGIYERLINALKSLNLTAIQLLFGGKMKEFARHVDLVFLATLGSGVITSVLTMAKVLEVGFQKYPVEVAALFFGLIAASVWSVAKMVKSWSFTRFVAMAVGLGIALALAIAPQAGEDKAISYLLLCGVVAMCSMIIPGISGSFVLLLMGNYHLIMITSLNKLREGKLDEALPVLIPVGVGAVVGLIALSHFLSWLFRKFHDLAVAVITGFVAGSLVMIWPWKRPCEWMLKEGEKKVTAYERYFPEIDGHFAFAFGIIMVGVVLMVMVEVLGATKAEKVND